MFFWILTAFKTSVPLFPVSSWPAVRLTFESFCLNRVVFTEENHTMSECQSLCRRDSLRNIEYGEFQNRATLYRRYSIHYYLLLSAREKMRSFSCFSFLAATLPIYQCTKPSRTTQYFPHARRGRRGFRRSWHLKLRQTQIRPCCCLVAYQIHFNVFKRGTL